MPQSGEGRIRLFNDFAGVAETLALTADTAQLGDFFAGGEGFEDNDAGVAGKDALSGVVTITSGNTDADTSFIGTHIAFDVALMGPIVLEARVQVPDLDDKEIFFGLTSILSVDEQLEDIVINASGTTITMPADLVGFYLSSELTDDVPNAATVLFTSGEICMSLCASGDPPSKSGSELTRSEVTDSEGGTLQK